MRRINLLLTLLMILPTPALAASQYQVELLLFLRNSHPGGEYWQANAVAPNPALAVATVQGGPPPSGGGTPALVTPVSGSAYKLNNHAEALRRKGLTPLLHTAWRQRVGGRNNKDWLWLDAGQVRGLIRISLGRYLHVDTDLALRTGQGDSGAMIHSVGQRRMRSGEVHYLDHPAFGILMIITPLSTANSATDQTAVSAG